MAGMLSTNSTPASTSAASSTSTTSTTSSPQQPLYIKYPISSQWEFKLNNGETVQGEIYCTDQVADLIILQDPTNNDIRMISVTSIINGGETQQITENNNGSDIEEDDAIEKAATVTATTKKVDIVHSKKVLDEREKRAIRLAQESLKHLNPKAPPMGQIVFDRLLKACNEVVWKGESIIVLDTIKVDPPYKQDDCKLLRSAVAGSGQSKLKGSLDRVQKIVSSIHNNTNNASGAGGGKQ